MKNNKNLAQWITLFLLGLALIVVYKAFDSLGWLWTVFLHLLSILTPFVVGFGIAFVLYGPVKHIDGWIRKSKWKFFQKAARPLAVFITYVLALGILYSAMYIGIMLVVDILYGILDPRIRVSASGKGDA